MLKTTPAVFAVGKEYQIMVPVTDNSLFWVEIGDDSFYDESNGIMRSLCSTHRVRVPMSVLDREKKYTVCERKIVDRKPYFPITENTVKTEFEFYPIPNDNIRIYHVADTHSRVDEPVRAAKTFGKIDLLIMNGDIPDHSGEVKNFDTIYEIADKITHGQIPIVFARGNHDMRGYHAEEIAEHTPNHNGNTYYTFRLGSIWGLVLDCGEDKSDEHPEYGFTVACHQFRKRQTEFIKSVINNAESEYAAEGVEHKLVVVHNPFTHKLSEPFGIETEIFCEWAKLIRENISPELMLCGHLHRVTVFAVGGDMDNYGQACPVVVGAAVGNKHHAGGGLTFTKNSKVKIEFCDSNGIKYSVPSEYI